MSTENDDTYESLEQEICCMQTCPFTDKTYFALIRVYTATLVLMKGQISSFAVNKIRVYCTYISVMYYALASAVLLVIFFSYN